MIRKLGQALHCKNNQAKNNQAKSISPLPAIFLLLVAPMFIFAFVIFSILSQSVAALPPPATEFYGTVIDNSLIGFPEGTNVSAFDVNGTMCGYYNVTSAGYYGILSCNGDDSDSSEDEGADSGDIISFRINNETASTLNDSAWSAGLFKRVDIFLNRAPILLPIGNLNASEDSIFYYDVNAIDDDNDTLTYSRITSPSFSSLTINSLEGVINFTPVNNEVGSYFIRFIVTDGFLNDYEDILFTVINTNDPPYFEQNLTNQTVYEASPVDYDINCSDDDLINGDTIVYSLNVSKITISSSTGIISWEPSDGDVGNYTINATCTDGTIAVGQIFTLRVIDINQAPVLSPIGDKSALSDAILTINITASDPDTDSLNFSSNHTGLSLAPYSITGTLATFSGAAYGVGNYTVNMSVTDGNYTDYEIFTIRIYQAPFCGDGICAGGENCVTCGSDCGSCPAGSSSGGGGSGGGAGGGSASGALSGLTGTSITSAIQGLIRSTSDTKYMCIEDWLCSPWGACKPVTWSGSHATGVTERTCRDLNSCNSVNNKPDEKRSCQYVVPGTCNDNRKNQNEEGIDCGGSCPPCPTCTDGSKNGREEGVDCGGPCEPCTIIKYAQLFLERPGPFFLSEELRHFPWLLLLVLLLITTFFTGYDISYQSYLKKKPFDVYRQKIVGYRKFRKRMYIFLANFDSLGILMMLYLYFLGSLFSINVWLLVPFILVMPVLIAFVVRELEYNEYRMATRERRLEQLHHREIRYFVRQEQELITEQYDKFLSYADEIGSRMKNSEDNQAFTKLATTIGAVHKLAVVSKKLLTYQPDNYLKSLGRQVMDDAHFRKFAKEYAEPHFALLDLARILKSFVKKEFDLEQEREFLAVCRDINRDKLLISVMTSQPDLIVAYNRLIDCYNLIKDGHKLLTDDEQSMSSQEHDFVATVDTLGSDKEFKAEVAKSKQLATLYNSLILIYNSIKKKRNLEKR